MTEPEMTIEMAGLDARHLLTRRVPCGHESNFEALYLASPANLPVQHVLTRTQCSFHRKGLLLPGQEASRSQLLGVVSRN